MRTIRLLVVLAVGAAGLAPALPAAAAVTSVTGVAPSRVDAPTTPWTTLDLTGSGLAAGDVVTSVPASSSVLFSSSVDDGAGGIKVNVRVNGATYGTYDLVVTDPADNSSATCADCLELGAAPLVTGLTSMAPHHGSLDLAWSVNAGSSPVTGYHVSWTSTAGDGATDTVDPSATISGLSDGVDYIFAISGTNGWGAGPARTFHEQVGVLPDQPAIQDTVPVVFGALIRTASGATWTLSSQLLWDIRATAPDGGTLEEDGLTSPSLSDAGQRGTYRVQVRQRNAVGSSPWSDPVDTTVITYPSPPRQLRATQLGNPVRLSWSSPADDGGSPIIGYDVDITSLDAAISRTIRTTGTSLVLNLRAGHGWSWLVTARTQQLSQRVAADGAFGAGFDTATVGVVATTDAGRARWRPSARAAWQRLGSRQFTVAPTAFRAHGRTYFAGSTRSGEVVIRTLSTTWHRLSGPACFDAGASVQRGVLWVACGNGSGRLLEMHTRLPAKGLPSGPLGANDTLLRMVGAPAVVRDAFGEVLVAFRSPTPNSRGGNVLLHHVEAAGARAVGLNCPSRPVLAAAPADTADLRALVACRTDRRHIAWWRQTSNGIARRTVSLPFAARRGFAIVAPAGRFELILRTASGLRRYDVRTATWRPLGGAFAAAVTALTGPVR